MALLLCMQITGDVNDEYLIMSMISRHALCASVTTWEEHVDLYMNIYKYIIIRIYMHWFVEPYMRQSY